MPLIYVYFAVSLYILSKLETRRCHTYQTEPLFLSFSQLAALERNSLDQTNQPNSQSGDHKVKTFVVKCSKEGVEVLMKADLFDPGLPAEARHLRLGSPISAAQRHCAAKASGNGEYVIRAPLTDCGGKVTSAVLYDNLLLYAPPGLFQRGAAIPLHCKYGRRYAVSSGALKPTWSPLISTQSMHLNLDFHLRLMADDWSGGRASSVYFLGETVNIEASVDHRHLPLRLHVDSCVAALTPDVNSYPRYPFIDHQGCFTDSKLSGSSSRFLPRVQNHLLRIQLQPFLFHQDHRHTMYITCYLEAEPVSSKDPVKRACSFTDGRWRSVDGDDRVCESCGAASNHKRTPRSKTKHRQSELHVGARLGPMIFLTTARKHKYLD